MEQHVFKKIFYSPSDHYHKLFKILLLLYSGLFKGLVKSKMTIQSISTIIIIIKIKRYTQQVLSHTYTDF